MKKAALFDMDGTLVDNSPVHVRAFEIFCARYGVTDWKEKLADSFGMGNDDIMRAVMPEEIIREKGLAALADEKEAIYREIYAPDIHPVEGLVELLERLRAAGVAPADCVIFEDAKAGLEAARRAGAGRIVALTTTLPRAVLERETPADMIVNNFAELTDLGALLA